jgi:hypothetical protein
MVDGLHMHIRNRTMKPPAVVLSRAGRGLQKGRDGGGDLTNVHCKAIQNCHNKLLCTMNIS